MNGSNATSRRSGTWLSLLLILSLATSFLLPFHGALAANAGTALQFNGTNQYVTFGAAPSLGAATFTLETWFKRTGAGIGTGTGSGGITSAVPLVTKGRAEADGTTQDMNYFLGIDSTSGKLVVDFEECAPAQTGCPAGGTAGLNHPVSGNAVVSSNVWHHAAATYDGQTWKLYLDGTLDNQLTLAAPRAPRLDSIQHAALATAMTSTGVAAGFFQGTLDEARIWNVARTQPEIQAAMNSEITSGTGLLGRWGMNEGIGTVVGSSVGSVNGTATNGPQWVAGFPIPDTTPPAAPQNLAADAGNGLVTVSWNANTETDLAGYNVYRGTSSPVSTTGMPLNGATPLTSNSYTDNGLTNGATYYYAVTAVDSSSNQSSASNEASATPQASAGAALQFNGSSQYVTFGPSGLGAATFTLETWFKRTGAGVGTGTGSGGITSAIPLVTKGRAEAENSNVDMNYFLGIDAGTGVLVADFEEGATGASPGLNHPVTGITAVTSNVWHHAAATYDGTTWKLYLDGALDKQLAVGQPPRSDSIQHAALATAMNSTGVAAGFFQGTLDEARIWNVARTSAQIQATMSAEVTSAAGLLGRWGMNEGSGTVVGNSAGSVNGTATNGPQWVAGYTLAPDTAPGAPQNLQASAGIGSVALTWDANGEPDLAGYNVYRSTSSPVSTSGTPLNGATLLTSPSYTDNNVASGTTYYYAVTAVDTANNQSAPSNEVSAIPQTPPPGSYALAFDGTNDYVTFGAAPSLGAATFTIETWFKRTGAGVGTNTGSGGIASAIPLVTKGRAEAEGSAVDMNYFVGIDATSGKLVADFEDMATGANHPVVGVTVISSNVWHHAAITYNGTKWQLYLDGRLETELAVGQTPRSDSIQHAALATAMNSTGVAAGFFQGTLDEARIWNYARSGAQIRVSKDQPIETATGLLGRWGMSEGFGTVVGDSTGNNANGTATNGPAWVAGYDFPADTTAPAAPQNVLANAGDASVTLTWSANGESDLAGYNVYRGTSSPVSTSGTPLNGADLLRSPTYADNSVTNGTTYYYVVVAVDGSDNTSSPSAEASATPQVPRFALAFNGGNDHVTFGSAPGLGAATFTLETWFKRTGAGVGTNTGSGGIASAIPLLTKGRAEAEGSSVDMNYFLGIDASTGVLVGDFEDMATGTNHPVSGVTVVTNNVWHHLAATYDGTTWKLYLDGDLDAKLTLAGSPTPRSDSIQHAALATAMNSTGVAAGFFQGTLDEARIWNVARSGAQIRASKDQPIVSAQGLIGRWGMNEGTGTTVADSSGSGVNGTLTNGPAWVAGYDFPADTSAPAVPQNLTATPADVGVTLGWSANIEADLAGYNIYRSTTSPVSTSGTAINGADLVRGTSYADDNLTNGTTYHYVVVAVDGSNNVSGASNEASATPQTPPEGAYGLDLGSGSAYVTFGDPAKLDLAQFTIETWFKRTGTGVANTTGTNGIASAIPLLTHGAPQADGSNVDENWILAIDDTNDVIAADFEDMATGANHPVYGTTTIANNVWHHAAATYDGTTWRLYLDGNLEATLAANAAPRSDTIQRAGLGTMIESGGTTHGHFQGVLDEPRVWNRALSATEIQVGVNQQLVSGSGLVARWGLNEGSSTTVSDSSATPANGTITGNGSSWVAGAPFNATSNRPPAQPALNAPTNGATGVATSPTLDVDVSDPDNDNLTVTFYGRPAAGGAAPGPDFTLIALPDTQYYASSLNGGSPAIFNSQTQWIVDNLGTRNIAFVTQLGDCTEHGNQFEVEWQIADTAFKTIENPTTTGMIDGMPYGIAPGNHDQTPTGDPTNGSTTLYNQYFGITRFQGRGYYGGHYGDNNDNHYELFSASGLNFIVVHLEYDPSAAAAVLTWADNLLKTHSERRAIVVSHYIINGGSNASFGTQGQAIYNALKNNPNLFLMLSGHVTSPVEGQRQDTFNGHTIYSLMSDYQARTNGGNGWLRIMEFSPANNQVRVKTYSPWLQQFETDADSQFTLAYDMGSSAPFQVIGTSSVPSGSNATATWSSLSQGTDYEWYATVSDGKTTTTGPTWTFTTQAPANHAPVADDQSVTMAEDAGKAITLSGSDADGNSLAYSVIGQPQHGTLTGTAPALNYTAAANYNGPDSFTFKANDGTADSNVATVSVDVTPVNDAPSFNKGADQTVAEDASPQTITSWATSILAGPANEASQTVDFVVSNNNTALFAVPPAVAADGTLNYTPAANANGSASVTVHLHDNGGTANGGIDTSTAQTFTITVTPVNDPPVANDQPVTAAEDTAKAITLSATDVENSPLTYTVLSGPSHGALSGNGPNRTYTPAANYNGPDNFTFKANDGTVDSNVATVSITVTSVNDAPVASGQSVSAAQGIAKAITLSASDVDGNTLAYSVVAGPAHGSLSGTAPNLAYISAANYSGLDSFTFKVNDGTVDSNVATISITVADSTAPAAPTGLAISLTSIAVNLDWNDNSETDQAGYNVYRSSSLNGTYVKLNSALLANSQYNDAGAPGGTSYYRVTAVDTSGNESSPAATNVSRIAFRAATSAKTTNKKLTISKPAGLANGDVMLASIAVASTATATAPAGWASIGTLTSGSMRQTIYWHVAAASEPASYTWNFTANQNAAGAIVAYSGAATTAPIIAGQANGSSTAITAPQVTTIAANSLVVGFFGIAASTTVSPPPGMLEQADVATAAGAKSKVTTEITDSIQAAAGPSEIKTATGSVAAANIGYLVALQPK
jgi:fibronectin type 3 domain-containing protein